MRLYNLVWMINGIVKETIMWNCPMTLVKWKKRVVRSTTHRTGVLKIVNN